MTRLGTNKESDLKSSIMEYLQTLENMGLLYCDRLNSGEILATYKDDKKRLIKLCKPGTADIFFIAFGRVTYIESKRKGEKQKPEQKEFQQKVESVGAFYWLIDNLDDFENHMAELGLDLSD